MPSPLQCPSGTVIAGNKPPQGNRQMCVTPDQVREGPWRFYFPNGYLQREGYYVQGRKSGTFKTWNIQGIKTSEGMYKRDRKFGVWKEWNRDGVLLNETPYVASDIHGYRYFFYENGNKSAEFYYIRGSLIDRQEFPPPGIPRNHSDIPFVSEVKPEPHPR
ncbi:MAG: hypothetical protein VX699_01405 [Myxococcota bacterium]|nr:hypothetical protein [Myxococcota bacterium]